MGIWINPKLSKKVIDMAHNKRPKEIVSYTMSKIKSKDTKPEMKVRRYLHSQGFRYRLHDKRYPGKPDIVLPMYRTVVLVNGCFWHMHGCAPRVSSIPKVRINFWTEKLNKNRQRDIENHEKLRALGWNVIIVWECELKKKLIDYRLKTLRYEIVFGNAKVE